MQANAITAHGDRSKLERSPLHRLPDRALKWGLSGLAAAILILIAYFFIRLIGQSSDALNHFGLSFVFGNDWDVSRDIYRGAAMLVGTLITATIALVIESSQMKNTVQHENFYLLRCGVSQAIGVLARHVSRDSKLTRNSLRSPQLERWRRERQNVCSFVLPAKLPVQRSQLSAIRN